MLNHVVIILILFLQSRLKELLQVACEPSTTVCLMVPSKNIALVNLSVCVDGECKKIAAAVVSEQKEVVERHVKVLETRRRPKLSVLLLKVAN